MYWIAVISLFLIALGLLGLFFGTIGAPLFALMLASRKTRVKTPLNHIKINKISILICAHNEQVDLPKTLTSLESAVQNLQVTSTSMQKERPEITVTVGLDHCTDGTLEAVRQFQQSARYLSAVSTIENPAAPGKWRMLRQLVAASDGEWVGLVDSGSIWRSDLLSRVVSEIQKGEAVGVAPAYVSDKGGVLERMNWRLEQAVKKLENLAGGPVSVHGATVFYRRDALAEALEKLEGHAWLNDDVVIPLTLRLSHAAYQIRYLASSEGQGLVSDVGVRSELGVEYRRRNRMIAGNLEWVRGIFFPALLPALAQRQNAVALTVASRRVFRLFWAYWVLAFLSGLFILGISTLIRFVGTGIGIAIPLAIIAGGGLLFMRSDWIRRLCVAFFSGLQVPRHWKRMSESEDILWA